MPDDETTIATRGHWVQIGEIRISVLPGEKEIVIQRDGGEGGWFSAREFHDMVQEFVSERQLASERSTMRSDMNGEPEVPCPYGDDRSVGLSYYLAHQADFCLHRGEGEDARLFQAASEWVRERANAKF